MTIEKIELGPFRSKAHMSCSSMCDFSRCKRRWFYKQGCRLAKSLEPHHALVFGLGIHAAIAEVFSSLEVGKTKMEIINDAMKAFSKHWEDRDKLEDSKRNSTVARLMIDDFIYAHSEERSIYRPMKGLVVGNASITGRDQSPFEVPFCIDLGVEKPVVGLIDCAAVHRDTMRPWAVEYKTSSQLSISFLLTFDINPQVFLYSLAMRVLGCDECDGTIVEGLLAAKTKTSTMCHPVHTDDISNEDIINWFLDLHQQMMACENERYFPKNISACSTYPSFGQPGFQCEYQELCQLPRWEMGLDCYIEREEKPFILSGDGALFNE